jgi:hypothetical protein
MLVNGWLLSIDKNATLPLLRIPDTSQHHQKLSDAYNCHDNRLLNASISVSSFVLLNSALMRDLKVLQKRAFVRNVVFLTSLPRTIKSTLFQSVVKVKVMLWGTLLVL